jgi:alcohol dehydrogenase
MAHQLGGFYNLPHGVCNAVLLPHVCEFNLIACPDRYAKIAQLMGVNIDGLTVNEAADEAIQAIRQLSAAIGIPSGLNELGVKEADLAIMAENAQKDACMLTNPRKATHAQVVDIFKAAM